jgi:hypothetical protein
MVMKVLARVTAQYYENYGSADAPYWKPKGGQEFTVRVDSDSVLYDQQGVENTLAHMLTDRSNEYQRYEFISVEFVFCEPIALDEDVFKATHDAYCNMATA